MSLWGSIKEAGSKAAGSLGHAIGGDFGEALAREGSSKLFDVAEHGVSKVTHRKKQKHAEAAKAASDSQGSTTIALAAAPKIKGGLTYLCTEMHRQGRMSAALHAAAHRFGLSQNDVVMFGYGLWARPLAWLMSHSALVTALVAPLVLAWAEHMANVQEPWAWRKNRLGAWIHRVGVPVCYVLGTIVPSKLVSESADSGV